MKDCLRRCLLAVVLSMVAALSACAESYFNPNMTQFSTKDGIDVKGDYWKETSSRIFTIDASLQSPATVSFEYEIILTGGAYESYDVAVYAEKAGKFSMKHKPSSASGSGTLTIKTNDKIWVDITVLAQENPSGTTRYPYYPGALTVKYKIAVSYGTKGEDGGSETPTQAVVSFDANGGTGKMLKCLYDPGKTIRLPANGFKREGYWFVGWSTDPNRMPTFAFKTFMLENCSLVGATPGITFDEPGEYKFYAIWKKKGFIISYAYNSSNSRMEQYCEPSKVAVLLTRKSFPNSGTFAGWKCSNGKRYDEGMLVHDLGRDGETVKMTAIWE